MIGALGSSGDGNRRDRPAVETMANRLNGSHFAGRRCALWPRRLRKRKRRTTFARLVDSGIPGRPPAHIQRRLEIVHAGTEDPRILWESERLIAQRLDRPHEAVLQHLFTVAGDYFLRVTGRPEPDPGAAAQELEACAASPGRGVAALIESESGEPIGAIGWWAGNPEPDVTLLGMLLVVPSHRGHGFAREAVRALEGWLAGLEMSRLRTAVAAASYAEHKLLRALGFEQMSIRDHTALGLGGSHLALFEKRIR
jgi:RimJ/RimL family protein N-acetyltransferase